MTDEQVKRAMKSACSQYAYMCSLPKTENTPREQRIKDGLEDILKRGKDHETAKNRFDVEWEYLKTMATVEDLEKIFVCPIL